MDEQEIDVVGAKPVQGMGDRSGCSFGFVVGIVDLRGDEEFLARYPRCLKGSADLRLVAVHLCGVDVAVSGIECAAHRVVGVGWGDLVGAEAQDGDRGARREGEVGDGRRGRGGLPGNRNVHR